MYELQGKDFEGISSYEEGLPIIRQKLSGRMKWVWGHDLEGEYVEARQMAGLGPTKVPEVVGLSQINGKIDRHGVSVKEIEA